jgi:hypothetical protein
MLEGKKGVHTWMILMTTTMMSLKKGVVEVFKEIRGGKMGLIET